MADTCLVVLGVGTYLFLGRGGDLAIRVVLGRKVDGKRYDLCDGLMGFLEKKARE